MNNAQSHRKLKSQSFIRQEDLPSDRPLTSKRMGPNRTVGSRMFKGVPNNMTPIQHVDAFLQNYDNLPKLMGSSRRTRIQSAKKSLIHSQSDMVDSEKLNQENIMIKTENQLLKRAIRDQPNLKNTIVVMQDRLDRVQQEPKQLHSLL